MLNTDASLAIEESKELDILKDPNLERRRKFGADSAVKQRRRKLCKRFDEKERERLEDICRDLAVASSYSKR